MPLTSVKGVTLVSTYFLKFFCLSFHSSPLFAFFYFSCYSFIFLYGTIFFRLPRVFLVLSALLSHCNSFVELATINTFIQKTTIPTKCLFGCPMAITNLSGPKQTHSNRNAKDKHMPNSVFLPIIFPILKAGGFAMMSYLCLSFLSPYMSIFPSESSSVSEVLNYLPSLSPCPLYCCSCRFLQICLLCTQFNWSD